MGAHTAQTVSKHVWVRQCIFHNLTAHDGHLIMQEIGKFDQMIHVIPNALEKYMSSVLGKNLVFITSMQFTDSSLKLVVQGNF